MSTDFAVIKLLALIFTEYPQVFGGYKRNSVQPQGDKKDFFIYQARDGGHSSLPLDLSSLSVGPLFLFYRAVLRKYWLHE